MIFAKIFLDDDGNQILAVNDVNEAGDPSIAISVIPDGLGLCTLRLDYEDSVDGQEKCDKAFEEFDQRTAIAIRNQVAKSAGGFTSG